jgi:hypothetical protein
VTRKTTASKRAASNATWRAMDLHLHTPASSDYQEPNATYLDILQTAEARGLDLIAFTDHNTVAGYRQLQDEIDELELLERLKRLQPNEAKRLAEYRRLLAKILVLPGFEFTATFGFHILGLFPPETPVRDIEHILLSLNVPSDQLDKGSATVGATADVLTAYQKISAAGGLVIAAHANSTNGVAMRGFTFGGQTKIAYTQDPDLHALEVTDLETKGRRTTAAFFNGSKPEYPRRLHCIQGSDAHRLTRDPKNGKNLGVGDRATDVLMNDVSFEALKAVFLGTDFARTRPHAKGGKAQAEFDYVQDAREQGPSIVQDFHESMTQRGGKMYAVLCDICGFANTNGGTLYVGVSRDPKQSVVGVSNAEQAIRDLRTALDRQMSPRLAVTLDTQTSGGKTVVRVQVPRGDDPPYALDENKIYVRQEAETSLAVRDEIVQLVVRRYSAASAPAVAPTPPVLAAPAMPVSTAPAVAPPLPAPTNGNGLGAPRTGVEIVATEERNGVRYHVMRDLRNNSLIKNVTRSSARKLWHYAIAEREAGHPKPEAVTWFGDLGLYKKREKGGVVRYDLVQKTADGLRVFFGVTEDGIHGEWRKVAGIESPPVAPVAPTALDIPEAPPDLVAEVMLRTEAPSLALQPLEAGVAEAPVTPVEIAVETPAEAAPAKKTRRRTAAQPKAARPEPKPKKTPKAKAAPKIRTPRRPKPKAPGETAEA